MSSTSLSAVITVDDSKCVNCHACITACPVKYCNDGGGDTVTINPDMCIACGNCISACTHDARNIVDDFDAFINDIIAKEKIVAISSPSTAASFPNMYLQINTWLKDLGVDAVFDVSFGAELTTKSYIEYIKKENPKTVIAQPCASIVTYIELYKPELLNCLIPVDSPMLHTIKMIKEFYPQYKDHKIAVISPCNAKKREFEETGMGDYNIGHSSIQEFLDRNKINLAKLKETDFDNPDAERAVSFSSPGGLLKTAERWIPGIAENTRKIEGSQLVYDYFDSLPDVVEKGMSPLLVDCLSCEFGCNAGPLTITHDKPQDEIEYLINKRSSDLKEKFLKDNKNKPELSKQKIEKTLNEYWKEGLYNRSYTNRWKNVDLKYPTEQDLKEIYVSMHKYTDEDIKNCSACGYGTCEGMAIAILNKLNKPENCHFYLSKETEISIERVEKSEAKLSSILNTSIDGFVEVDEDEVIVSANPAFKKILKKSDIIGRSILDFIDNKNLPTFAREIENRERGKLSSYELEFKQSDNSSICCLVSSSKLLSFGTKKGSFAMVSDISELKKSEAELKKFNENLEKIVATRTAELNEAVEELNATNEAIEEANKELEKLSIVASETDNAIAIMDNLGNFQWLNRAYTEKYGLTLEALIQQKGKDIITATKSQDITGLVYDVLDKKISQIFEILETDKEQNTIYTQVTLTPILNKENEVKNIVAINTDISKIKQKENELLIKSAEMSELIEELNTTNEVIEDVNKELEQLSIVASETDNAIIIMDNAGNFQWFNEAYTKKYGFAAEQLISQEGGNFTDVYKNVEDINEIIKNVIKNKNTVTFQYPETNVSGKKIYTQTDLTPILDPDNNIKNIIAISTDITKLKEAEEEIMQRNEEITQQKEELQTQRDALADSEEQIKYILNSLPDATFVIDKNGIITFWNKAIEEMTAIKATDMLGKGNYEYAMPFYNKRRPLLIDLVSKTTDEIKTYKGIINNKGILQGETFIKNLKGKERFIIGTASKLFDADGNNSGAIEIMHDITDRKNDENKLKNQQKHITDSIVYASRIQNALLPPEGLINKLIPESFVFYKPRDIVSGDFYWFTKRNYKIVVVAADCTGHGVPGAFMSMLGISSLNEIVNKEKITQPDIILNKMRKMVKKTLRQKGKRNESQEGMDVAICTFEPGTNTLQYAGAYNPLYIVRDNELLIYKADKMPVGVHRKDSAKFLLNTIETKKGDTFYIFSDGFIDQIGEKTGRKFLVKNFKTFILSISDKTMTEQKELIEAKFIEWKGSKEQIDDLLIWGIKL